MAAARRDRLATEEGDDDLFEAAEHFLLGCSPGLDPALADRD